MYFGCPNSGLIVSAVLAADIRERETIWTDENKARQLHCAFKNPAWGTSVHVRPICVGVLLASLGLLCCCRHAWSRCLQLWS